MLLGLPGAVWAVLGIEFVERLGYYAVSFSLFTYCTVMLRTGPSAANAIINVIYILIPAAAFLASGIADSSVGRPRVLAVSLVVYTLALLLLFASACPFMYDSFPSGPRTLSKALFAVSLLCFSAGYGSMKVCTNPIMADCVVLHYRGRLPEREEDGEGGDGETATGRRVAGAEGGASGALPSASPALVTGREGEEMDPPTLLQRSSSKAEEDAEPTPGYGSVDKEHSALGGAAGAAVPSLSDLEAQLEQRALSRLFIYAYWIANVGGLVGSFVAPLLRNGESRVVEVGSETHTTGYYYSFLLASGSVGLGGVFLYRFYHWLPRNAAAPNYVLVRVLVAAAVNRIGVWRGTKRLADPTTAAPPRDWLDYASAELYTATDAEVTIEGEWAEPAGRARPHPPHRLDCVTTAAWVDDCRVTLGVCKAFVALPVYWLLSNQFSTNLMYQAMALDLPVSIPEELFNNVNTVTMLVFLALWDRWIVPQALQHRVPSACLRIVVGFACMCASMLWCGLLQCAIMRRGSYEGEDSYVLNDGSAKLSAGWLVVPYVLQGFASAFVDPTVMEVAYRDAPARMKGTVMGLYWVASSASGFLGLVLSPVMKPQNATVLFFSFAIAQMVVSALFYVVNRNRAY